MMQWDIPRNITATQTTTNKAGFVTPCSLWDAFLKGIGIAHNLVEKEDTIEIQVGVLEDYDMEWNTFGYRKYFVEDAREDTSEHSLTIIFDKAGQFKRFEVFAAE